MRSPAWPEDAQREARRIEVGKALEATEAQSHCGG
jgi:hypothetical protein